MDVVERNPGIDGRPPSASGVASDPAVVAPQATFSQNLQSALQQNLPVLNEVGSEIGSPAFPKAGLLDHSPLTIVDNGTVDVVQPAPSLSIIISPRPANIAPEKANEEAEEPSPTEESPTEAVSVTVVPQLWQAMQPCLMAAGAPRESRDRSEALHSVREVDAADPSSAMPSGLSAALAAPMQSSAPSPQSTSSSTKISAETATGGAPAIPAGANPPASDTQHHHPTATPSADTTARPVVTAASAERNLALAAHDSQALVQRLAEWVGAARETGRELAVRLSPPELGPLLIEVHSDHGVITARLETQTAAAQQTLLEHVSQLHDALAQRGAAIERIDVVRAEPRDVPAEAFADPQWTGAEGQSGQGQHESPRRRPTLVRPSRPEAATVSALAPRERGLREINVRI